MAVPETSVGEEKTCQFIITIKAMWECLSLVTDAVLNHREKKTLLHFKSL